MSLNLTRCCSSVGRIGSRYIQRVSIASFCSFATVVHEIGHVLGFWHEQSRPDRDEYITIHEENIRPGYHSDFNKIYTINSLGVPYDYNSIMHYRQTAFAKTGTITISTKEDDIPFGRAPELSHLDIIQTELLYKDQCSKLYCMSVFDWICKTCIVVHTYNLLIMQI